MGDGEVGALALMESTLGYHPFVTGLLTLCAKSRWRTLSAGQFDWGGRLLKSNGGVQRFPQDGWKPFKEYKGTRELDCETNKSSRYESRT